MKLCIRETPSERERAARESAMAVLRLGQNRLALLVASLVCFAASFVCYFTVWAISLVCYEAIGDRASFWIWLAMQILVLVLVWLLAMPLWLGMYRMAHRMMHGAAAGSRELFAYVTSAAMYGRALGISWRLLLRWIPAGLGYLVLQIFWDPEMSILLTVFFALTVVLSLTFVSGLGGLVTASAADDSLTLRDASDKAQELLCGERMHVLRYDIGLTCRLIVSLIPVGVPFLLQTLPHAMLCSAAYCERLAACERHE